MTIRHFAFFAAAATLSLAASAQPNVQSTDAARTAPRASGHHLTRDEAYHMRGTYRLDDGRDLVITSDRGSIYAQLDGKTEELVPQSNQTFVARDSGTRLTFNQVPYADEVVVDAAVK